MALLHEFKSGTMLLPEVASCQSCSVDVDIGVAEAGAGVVWSGCCSFMRVTSLMLYDKLCVMSRVTPNCLTVHLPADRIYSLI